MKRNESAAVGLPGENGTDSFQSISGHFCCLFWFLGHGKARNHFSISNCRENYRHAIVGLYSRWQKFWRLRVPIGKIWNYGTYGSTNLSWKQSYRTMNQLRIWRSTMRLWNALAIPREMQADLYYILYSYNLPHCLPICWRWRRASIVYHYHLYISPGLCSRLHNRHW